MTKKKVKVVQPEPIEGTWAVWICTPFGILMPAALPDGVADKLSLPHDALQVRAREAQTLDMFRALFCPELDANVETPALDYDVRAYVQPEHLAAAMSRMAYAIDAPKFKPLVDGAFGLPDKDKASALHDCYIKVWSIVLTLGKAKSWGNANVSKPDTNASSAICQREGHLFPVGSKGGRVRAVTCRDCDAIQSTLTKSVHYPKNHQVWQPKAAAS